MSKMSEYSETKAGDAEFERRSKHKHDAPKLEPESESESESDSQHVSNTVDRQDSPKEQQSQVEKSTKMSKRSEFSGSRNDSAVFEKRSKRKHDAPEPEHEPQSNSLHISESKTSDAEFERRSKRKHDAPKLQPEPKSSQHVSDESQEEKAANEASQTSRVQYVPEPEVTRSKRQSLIIFTYKDQKKILKRLHESGYTKCTVEFWELVRDSLKLSTSFNQVQLYQKIRRLQHKFINRCNSKSRKVMSEQDLKLYQLSCKIWKKEAKGHKKAKPEHAVEDNNYDAKLGKLVMEHDVKFNVAESLDVVPASKRRALGNKWNDLNVSMLKLFKARIDLIQETMGAVVSSPSFTYFHDD